MADDDVPAVGKVVVEKIVAFGNPIVFGVGDCSLIVSPSGGFCDDGLFDVGGFGCVECGGFFGGENSFVIKVFVGEVCEQHSVFCVPFELLVNSGGAAVVVSSDGILVEAFHGVLSIPVVIAPVAVEVGAVSGGIPVLVTPIGVAHVELQQHVVDEGFQIQHLHDLLVVVVDGEVEVGCVYQGDVGIISSADDGGASVFDNVVIFRLASPVVADKVVVRAFVEGVEAPVESINVNVNAVFYPNLILKICWL